MSPAVQPGPDRWLIALDIDGTLMHEDGSVGQPVLDSVERVREAGHEVMIATGRPVASTLPVLERFELLPEYVVCSNGAILLKRDPDHPTGYRREQVVTFDPTDVLTTIRTHLTSGHYAVEDENGFYRYTDPFPDASIGLDSEHVTFSDLLHRPATRVVVIAPGHDTEDFLRVVERMGLSRVTYAIGWTAWLDISPEGVNKSTALETVRTELGFDRSRVFAVGDGRNDIDMLRWASAFGQGYAMGHAPDDVKEAAGMVVADVHGDGAAEALTRLLDSV